MLLDISNHKSENYGKYLSNREILDIIQPDDASISKVKNWLKSYNILFDFMGDIHCVGNIKVVEDAFKIKIVRVADNKHYIIDNYHIVPELTDVIEFIEGLSKDYSKSRIFNKGNKKNINNDIVPDPGYVGREVLLKLYNITDSSVNDNISVGAIYQGNSGFSQSDLTLSQISNNENKNVSKNHIGKVL